MATSIALEAQEEKYRRGAAWRAGKLDEYDAVHHPEKLRERHRAQAVAEREQQARNLPECPISRVLDELGIHLKGGRMIKSC